MKQVSISIIGFVVAAPSVVGIISKREERNLFIQKIARAAGVQSLPMSRCLKFLLMTHSYLPVMDILPIAT